MLINYLNYLLDSIAVPLFSNPNYGETSKLVYYLLLQVKCCPLESIKHANIEINCSVVVEGGVAKAQMAPSVNIANQCSIISSTTSQK